MTRLGAPAEAEADVVEVSGLAFEGRGAEAADTLVAGVPDVPGAGTVEDGARASRGTEVTTGLCGEGA